MKEKNIYLLYEGDAYLSKLSMTLIAPFTSFKKMLAFLRKNSKEYGLNEEMLKEFEKNHQTQCHETNYICKEVQLNVPCS